jgi:hypothetical protein
MCTSLKRDKSRGRVYSQINIPLTALLTSLPEVGPDGGHEYGLAGLGWVLPFAQRQRHNLARCSPPLPLPFAVRSRLLRFPPLLQTSPLLLQNRPETIDLRGEDALLRETGRAAIRGWRAGARRDWGAGRDRRAHIRRVSLRDREEELRKSRPEDDVPRRGES